MSNPAADDHRLTTVTDQSDSDEEYEEIEVEEETEVEDDDEDDFGEDLSPVNKDQRDDVSPDNKIMGREDPSHSGSITQEDDMKLQSTTIYAVEGNRGADISDQMDVLEGRESHINNVNLQYSELGKDVIAIGDHEFIESKSFSGTKTPKDYNDAHYKNKALPNDIGILTVQSTECVSNAGAKLVAEVSVKGNLGEKTTGLHQYSEEEKKRSHRQTEDIKLNEPRSDFLMAKRRSLSPGVESKDGIQRPAAICDFFAKGWCIKGNSCRFLHVKDVTTQHVGAEADASHETERRTSEGLDCSSKKPRLASFPDEEAPAIDTSYSLDRVLSHELGQNSKWKSESQELNPYRDNSRGAGREYQRENWYLNDHAKHGSAEMAAKRSQFLLGERIPPFRHSWETSFSTGTLPPTHISSWTSSSMSLGSTSWNLDPLSSLKCLDGEREYGISRSASLQKTSSPFSGSESGNPYRKPISGDFRHSFGYKTEMSSYNWEPSTPFRPSFSLTQSLLSSVNQYDPIRDSMEQSKSGDVHSRFSGAGRGTIGSEYNFGEQSIGGHHNVHDSILNKKNYGNDLFSAETGTPVTAVTEMQSRITAPKEEKLLGSANLQDLTKRDTPNIENDYATQIDRTKQKTKSVDMAGPISEVESDVKIGEDIAKETKALKHFRASLIDFIKELVKPTWREGNLSKDAHKMIVKRSVDRVLSTIPTHQIPSTPESVELYLSSSEAKIAKLVEGYIDKYGKL